MSETQKFILQQLGSTHNNLKVRICKWVDIIEGGVFLPSVIEDDTHEEGELIFKKETILLYQYYL